MKQFIKAALLLALLITLSAVGTVRAAELTEIKTSAQWRVTNPCFNDTGKWYTRGEAR